MVRLRSNRWYSNENQRRIGRRVQDGTHGRRRLISLIFMLGLVLLLMQRARDPAVIHQAFDSLGVPLDRETVASTHAGSDGESQGDNTGETRRSQDDDLIWRSTCQDLLARILNFASPTQLNYFAEFWFAGHWIAGSEFAGFSFPESVPGDFDTPGDFFESANFNDLNSTRDAGDIPEAGVPGEESLLAWLQSAKELVSSLSLRLDASSDSQLVWQQAAERFMDQWEILLNAYQVASAETEATGDAVTTNPLDPIFREELDAQLDQRLNQSLRDASPWTREERVAFWRLLQRGNDYRPRSREDPPLIATRQLERSFGQYRDKWIRFRGSVRQVELVERSHPAFGIDRYWVLWLKGADGSSQPVAVYSAHPLAGQLKSSVDSGNFPDIEMIALAGKRLAYGSQAGVQVAPTLFAGSILQFAPEAVAASQASFRELSWPMASAALTATLLSGLLLFFLWPQLRQAIRRKHRRFSKQPVSKGSQSKIVLLFAILANAFPCSADQPTPPWAIEEVQNQTPSKIIEMRLAESFPENEMERLQSFVIDRESVPPDGLIKVFHALHLTGWHRALATTQPIPAGQSLRLVPIQCRGWVQSVEPIELTEEQQLWFSLDSRQTMYRLNMVLGSSGDDRPDPNLTVDGSQSLPSTEEKPDIFVFCSQVPSQWLGHQKIYQPVSIRGFSLESQDDGETPLSSQLSSPICLITQTPAWTFPEDAIDYSDILQPSMPDRWLRLGVFGWDLAWLDLLARNQQKPITTEESPALLSLLRIVKDLGQGSESDRKEAIEVLQDPDRSIAAPVDWTVRLVMGSKVELTDSSLPELSYDNNQSVPGNAAAVRYYQFDGFVKLPGQTINYLTSDQQESVQFEGEYPVTILMADDSEFVAKNELGLSQATWKIGRNSRVQGRFFRLWSYRSERLSSSDRQRRQVAPLIIASSLVAAPPEAIDRAPVGWFGYALTGLVSLIMFGILFSVMRDTWSGNRSRNRKIAAEKQTTGG